LGKLLAVDIGGGTQDILLYDDGKTLENCIQLVLPSPTRLVAKKIAAATREGKAVFLHGTVMGGGPSVRAVKEHLAAGLAVWATPEAALTVNDDLGRVRDMGVGITQTAPETVVPVKTGDIDPEMYRRILGEVGEELPGRFAVAVQDHGFAPGRSNREFRFKIWEDFMAAGGRLQDLAYGEVPAHFNRMRAAAGTVPGALLMDTCGAALLGALCDGRVSGAAGGGGAVVVNIGNQHTFAALVREERVLGLFEHHTALMTEPAIRECLEALLSGTLRGSEVKDSGGHGAIAPVKPVKPELLAVTGPRRDLLAGSGYYFPAPGGNMMLMGCFGLVAAARNKEGLTTGPTGGR
jgi:uncharacterized protein (DUF1786 family)